MYLICHVLNCQILLPNCNAIKLNTRTYRGTFPVVRVRTVHPWIDCAGFTMKRIRIASTIIASIGYDETWSLLECEFMDGTIHQYSNVHRFTYDRFMTAAQKGRFFRNYIENRFPAKKIR